MGQGFSHRSSAASRREILTGSLPRLHHSRKNEDKAAYGPFTAVSHSPLWLASEWECRDRHLSTEKFW
jgi:hypothetical protein